MKVFEFSREAGLDKAIVISVIKFVTGTVVNVDGGFTVFSGVNYSIASLLLYK